MHDEESVLEELAGILKDKLPDYIQKLNEEHNDGLILPAFCGVAAEGGQLRLPYLTLALSEGEYDEKDRIIENVKYTAKIGMVLPMPLDTGKARARYRESIRLLVQDSCMCDAWQSCTMALWKGKEITVEIVG